MQFLFGDWELLLRAQDLLTVSTDVIVNPSNSQLTFPGGLSVKLLMQAGEQVKAECEQVIQEYGQIDSGMAIFTSAGKLPYQAVIHAVGPKMGEGNEQFKLEQAVSRSLKICEVNDWSSIAFPLVGAGNSKIPIELCAQAFFRAITHFWDARRESVLENILICTTDRNFQPFLNAFREKDEEVSVKHEIKEESVGEVTLSEEDISSLEDRDIDGWFK